MQPMGLIVTLKDARAWMLLPRLIEALVCHACMLTRQLAHDQRHAYARGGQQRNGLQQRLLCLVDMDVAQLEGWGGSGNQIFEFCKLRASCPHEPRVMAS